jgi:tryptophan synthase beta chain
MEKENKILLPEREMPHKWFNALAHLPFELPPALHPVTKKPLVAADLTPIFPMELIRQEVTTEPWIDIPDEVLKIYHLWRPTPLKRARRLEKMLKTSCRIYYKDESVSPTGSHKTNTAIPQAFYNKKAGIKRLTTETGAGQWGCALSFACDVFGLKCRVYMVKVSFQQKPFRKTVMRLFGSEVVASPSEMTGCGRQILKKDPHCQGSLGMAISEAVEDAGKHKDTNYALGSVLNHVLLHQTIIGLEAKKQLALAGEKPDYLVACVGGGSNFGGFTLPFIKEKIKNDSLTIVAVEPSACPSLTRGVYAYDYGDTSAIAPIVKMFTLGHNFVPPGIHAGGLRYHGCSSIISALCAKKLVKSVGCNQLDVFDAAHLFLKAEGIIPAPESSHAIKAAIDIARRQKNKCIVFNLSGHGFLDLGSYEKYLDGELKNYSYPLNEIRKALKDLPKI